MKKLYALMMGAIALSAVAANPLVPSRAKMSGPAEPMFLFNQPAHRDITHAVGSSAAMHRAPAREAAVEDVIVAPEGEARQYAVDVSGFKEIWGQIQYVNDVVPSEIVWGDDGSVYFKDIISEVQSGVYVKGTYADGQITVELPQVCYAELDDPEYPFMLYATVCELYSYEEDGDLYLGYRNVAPELNKIVYNVGDDGSVTLALNDGDPYDMTTPPQYIIGLVEEVVEGENTWWGYGNAYQCYTEFDEVATELPDDIELEEWVLIAESLSATAEVGFVGDDVYITNFWEFDPMVTIKGTVEGDKVVFPQQFLGIVYGYYIYLRAFEWDSDEFNDCVMLDALVMDYDAEAKVMAVNNPLIDLVFNVSADEYYPADYYENPTFRYQEINDVCAAPEDPFVVYYSPVEYRSYLGYDEGYIEWFIPNINVNGFLLDTDDMYYHFLVNGEVMTFTVEEYPRFDEDLTDVPYDYTDDNWDLQVIDQSHYFSFRFTGAESFGLQSFFMAPDGEVYASNIVTYVPEETGVSVSNAELRSVEFFDLSGRRVVNPESGVYIVRSTFADGTVKISKLAK